MTPAKGGWSDARERGLASYTGAACRDCGGTVKMTRNKECANKCYLKRAREQKARRKAAGHVPSSSRFGPPEDMWRRLAPDYRD